MKVVIQVLLFFSVVSAQPEIPELKYWITDYTKTLSSEEINHLNRKLKTYEDTTSTQLIVLMIATLQQYPIEEYALKVAEKNRIGTKKDDNGLLLLIIKNDRELRIEVGEGLEGVIPDAMASSIIRNIIIPHFRRDEYYRGIESGIDAMIAAAAGEYSRENKDDDTEPLSFNFIYILFLLILFFLRKRGRRKGIVFLPGGLGGFGGRGGGFGGGGFSGGGGSFGGGGASGRW